MAPWEKFKSSICSLTPVSDTVVGSSRFDALENRGRWSNPNTAIRAALLEILKNPTKSLRNFCECLNCTSSMLPDASTAKRTSRGLSQVANEITRNNQFESWGHLDEYNYSIKLKRMPTMKEKKMMKELLNFQKLFFFFSWWNKTKQNHCLRDFDRVKILRKSNTGFQYCSEQQYRYFYLSRN